MGLALAACGGGGGGSAPPATPALFILADSHAFYGVNTTKNLSVSVPAGVTVTWSSSNSAIISVSNAGVATGIAPGRATITASASTGATASIVLQVMPMGGFGVNSIDRAVIDFMVANNVPGGTLAVVHDNSLVVSRSYGLSDTSSSTLAQPNDRVRIASVSKPVASVATMVLVEAGSINLDDFVFTQHLTSLYNNPGGPLGDSRFGQITIRHLLRHLGGWNRSIAGDPMFMSRTIAAAEGVASPAEGVDIVRYMLRQPLQFTPGTSEVYSNFGYTVLARAIESVTGEDYESFVIDNVFVPAGINQNRIRVGGTRAPDLLADEMTYYGLGSESGLVPSVFNDGPASVPWPYGGFYLRAMDGNGGWVASAPDLVQFALAVDGDATTPDVINAGSRAAIMSGFGAGNAGYGLGWYINAAGDWSHTGRLQGSWSHLSVGANGTHFAVLFNASQPADSASAAMVNTVTNAVRAVSNWP